MKTSKLSAIICLLLPLAATAQPQAAPPAATDTSATAHISLEHELLFSMGGGISSLRYAAAGTTAHLAGSGGLGVGYRLAFTPQWSLSIGMSYNHLNGHISARTLADAYRATDHDNPPQDFIFRYTLRNLSEQHSLSTLTIPLMAGFHFGHNHIFYAGLGAKAVIPVSGTYQSHAAQLEARGDYTATNGAVLSEPSSWGFGDYSGIVGAGSLKFKTTVMLAARAGARWPLGGGLRLYAGFYLDYAPANILPHRTQHNRLLAGAPGTPATDHNHLYRLNSLLASTNSAGQPYATKVGILSCGISIQLAFNPGFEK